MKYFHESVRYSCKLCDQKTKEKPNLKSHNIQTHEGWRGKIFLQSVRLKSRKFHIEAVHGGEEIWVHISEVEKELWTLKHDLTWSDRLTFDCFRGLLMLLAEKWKQEEVHKQAGIRFFSGKFCRRRTKYLCFLSFIFQVRRWKCVNLAWTEHQASSQWTPFKWKAGVAVENKPVSKKTPRLVYRNFVLLNKP